jgi:hypothetical protein
MLVIGFGALQVQSEERPALEIAPLTQLQEDILFDSLRSDAVLALPALKTSQVVDPNIAGVWAGSKTSVVMKMSEVTLRFRRKVEELVAAAQTGKDLTNELLESFELVLRAQAERIELRHSHSERQYDSQGVWVPIRSRHPKTLVPFIPGKKGSGVYVAVLQTEDRDNNWGVFVCPRGVSREGTKKALHLNPSYYELFEAKVGMEVDAEVRRSTSGQPGRVKVTLDLSSGLPPSRVATDESISALPRGLVKYKPKLAFDFFKFKPNTSVQQGALVTAELHNKAGYLRRQFFSRYLYLHRTQEQTGVPVFLIEGRAVNDTGECYVVVEQANSWMEYDKVPASF